MKALRTNTVIGATSQYMNFEFTSLCNFNGVLLAAGPEGLFNFNVGSDDAGTPIEAYFIPHVSDFGLPTEKTIAQVYAGFKSDGEVAIEIIGDGQESIGPYSAEASTSAIEQKRRITPGKGYPWSYGTLKFLNVGGSDFVLYSLQLLLAKKSHGVK